MNNRKTINILLLGSGTQSLAILKDLTKIGGRVFIVVDETGNYGDESKYIYKRFVFDRSVCSREYLDYIIKLIQSESIDVVLPMGDVHAEFLSKNKRKLETIAHFKAPDYYIFQKGYDKNLLMTLCQEKGYPHPTTIDLSKLEHIDKGVFDDFTFPGLLKPNCTTGGRGMTLVNDYIDLCKKYPIVHKEYGDCHLQRFIREGGRQVKIQLYVEDDGSLIASSVLDKVRWYPVKGGASCCSVSITDDKIVSLCYRILKDIGWIGFADFDAIEDPDTSELLIMEINPRLPACIGASIYAGINWGEILVRGSMGIEHKSYVYQEGVTLRHLGFDMLWFLHSPNRYKVRPSWLHFFGKNVYYQDFHLFDQKPFWIGTYHNIKKLFDPSFKKAKSGTSTI